MAAANDDDNSRCARCGAAFHCGVADAAPCVCSTLKLDAATLAALRSTYTGCLCIACLSMLAHAATGATNQAQDTP